MTAGQRIERSGDQAGLALAMVDRAISEAEAGITAATETQLQNALHALRAMSGDPALVGRVERAAATMRLMAAAKREGRVNFYQSKLLRLRREFYN
jgi:hypothetical protein